jgi:hypothetical protein
MPNSAPDFTKKYLPQSELVDWLCTLGETSAFVRRNILEQIRLAIKKRELPGSKWKKGKRSLEVQPFLSWAATKKGWSQAIRATPGVTVSISVFVSGVEATAINRSVFSGPPEIARIEELEEENRKLKSENELLKGQRNKPYSDEKHLSEGEEEAKSLWGRAFQSGIQK